MYHNLLKLQPHHGRDAANMMATAFMEDPFFSYLFPNYQRRRKVLPVIYKAIIERNIKEGTAFATSEKMEGVLLFTRSQRQKRKVNFLIPFLKNFLRIIRLSRYISVIGVIRRTNKLRPATQELFSFYEGYDSYIHLNLIAVDKRFRGKGFMGTMMRSILEECNKTKTPCILDTEAVDNIPIYQHYGFRLAKTIEAAPGEMNYYIMVYQPKDPIKEK